MDFAKERILFMHLHMDLNTRHWHSMHTFCINFHAE